MSHTATADAVPGIRGLFMGPDGACGRLILSFGIAGGVAGGGVVVGFLVMAGMVSPGFQLLVAPVLFLAGAFLGLVHGGVLAVVGRPAHLSRSRAVGRAFGAALLSLPIIVPTYVVTAGVSLTAALVGEWHLGRFLLAAVAWVVALVFCFWAAREGWQAVQRAYSRWPESRAGSVITVILAVVVSLLFLWFRPELLGTGLRVNGVGAVVLAVVATLWIGLPLVVTALRYAPERIVPHAHGGEVGP